MKKIICALLCLALLAAGVTALAEDFQLRNGILFGDDLDTVKAKETLTIEDGSADSTNKVWFKGTIAGMDGEVRFDFDEETGGLTDMLYNFSGIESAETVDADYKKLYDSLNRKYGAPLGNTDGGIHLITGQAFEYFGTIVGLYGMLDFTGDYRNYDEWIVESDGYSVKIDMISYYTCSPQNEYNYYLNVSYRRFTDMDLIQALLEQQTADEEVDKDL